MEGPGTLPTCCSVALKEWASIVRALLAGRQTVLLRKGGIEEGPGGFRPEHGAFWLYPTQFHQQSQGVTEAVEGPELEEPEPGQVVLPGLAVVTGWRFVEDEAGLAEYRGEHLWTDETVRQRFHYRKPGLWAIRVGVYEATPARVVEERPEFAGCKSWVELGRELGTEGLEPVEVGPRRGGTRGGTSPESGAAE